MKQDKFISTLQSFFGVTKSELVFAVIIIVGLSVGIIVKMILSETGNGNSKDVSEVYRILDSLAEVEKTTYTGIDLDGNTIEELAAGDTTVKHNGFWQEKKSPPSGKININTATKTELMFLPGVSSGIADKIIAERKKRLFGKPSEIRRINGIGRKKFKKMKEYIVVR